MHKTELLSHNNPKKISQFLKKLTYCTIITVRQKSLHCLIEKGGGLQVKTGLAPSNTCTKKLSEIKSSSEYIFMNHEQFGFSPLDGRGG